VPLAPVAHPAAANQAVQQGVVGNPAEQPGAAASPVVLRAAAVKLAARMRIRPVEARAELGRMPVAQPVAQRALKAAAHPVVGQAACRMRAANQEVARQEERLAARAAVTVPTVVVQPAAATVARMAEAAVQVAAAR